MAVAYRSEFTSIGGIQWKLEIDDALGVGIVRDFKVDSRGFVLNYQGNEQDIFNPVISSTATFTMLVNSAVLEQFVDTLVTSAEERFRLVAYRNNELFWVGIILNDSVREEDLPYPYGFEIQAVDGLARLNRKEYAFTNPTLHDTFIVHLRRIMLETQTQDLWNSGNYMKMVVNWYESSLGTVGTNSLEQVSFANSLFTDIDKSGNIKAKNYLEVLQEICKVWGARFFQSGGYYWLVQIGEYDEDNFREWTYDTNLDTPVATVEEQAYEIEIDKITRFKLSAMQKTWLPPLLKAAVNYKHYTNSANALGNFIWKRGEQPHEETVTELVTKQGGNTSITIGALVEYTSNIDESTITQHGYPFHRYKWAMTLRVLDSPSGSNYYLNRDAQGNDIFEVYYGRVTWELGSIQKYEFWSYPVTEEREELRQEMTLSIETPKTFFSGTVFVNFELLEVEDMEGNNLLVPGMHPYVSTHDWRISGFTVNINDAGESEAVPSDDLRVYSLDGNSQNSFIKEVDIRFADGPQDNSTSALKIGSNQTTAWNIGSGSEGLKIAELLAKDMLGFQKNPVEVISGSILAKDLFFHQKIKIGIRLYICMRASYTTNSDEWNGAWVQVDKDSTGTVTEVVSPVDINDTDIPISTDDVTNGGGGGSNPRNEDDVTDNLDVGITNLIALTKTTQNVIAGTNYTSISVLAVDAFIPSGSSIALVRPDNGLTEIITLTDDYNPNDTTISVNHTFTNSFPANTFVFPDYTAIINNSNTPSKAQTEPVRPVTGATYTIANFTLPDPNTVTAEEINRRLRIERGGLRIYYPLQYLS